MAYKSATPEKVTTIECDITSDESVAEAFKSIASLVDERSVFPSILVNAAGT